MGRVIVNNAVGVDKEINGIQDALIRSLFTNNGCNAGWSQDDFEIYHKAYKNPTQNGVVPEAYTQNSVNQKDYHEVLLNDNYTGTIFFTVDDTLTPTNNNKIETNVSIFFQLNIEAIYDNLDYRQVEPAHNDVMKALRGCANVKNINQLVQTIPLVYSEFRTDNIQYDDMQPYHVFRVDVTVDVDYDCQYYCQFPPSTEGGFDYILDFLLG